MTQETALGPVPYVLPAITSDSQEYWTGGARGELRIYQCKDCSRYIHPPAPVCRFCRSLHVGAETVSGRGRVVSFTVNHQQWAEEFNGPFLVALVEIDEQTGLHLTTNLVECSIDEVSIDMRVEAVFAQLGDAWLPVFRPIRQS